MISSFLKSICFSIILLFCSVGNGLVQAAACPAADRPVECIICYGDITSSLIGVPYGESNHYLYHLECLKKSISSTNKEECPHLPGVPLDNFLLDGVGLPGKAELNLGEGEFLYRFVSRDFDRPVSKVHLNIHSSWLVVQDAQERGYKKAIEESTRITAGLFSQLFDRHNDQIKKLQEEKQALERELQISRSSEEGAKKKLKEKIILEKDLTDLAETLERELQISHSSEEGAKKRLNQLREYLQISETRKLLGLRTKKVVPVPTGFGIDMLHKNVGLKF